MLQIPIQAVPSQQVLCILDGQNCQIAIYQKGSRVFVDINSNGVDMCIASRAHNGVPIDPCNSYDGFQGNLLFIDTQGLEDPQYTGFGTRWFLIYLDPAELALAEILPTITPASGVTLTLSATLEVTSSEPGNFTIAHDLSVIPVLIEILPTSNGAIWGQSTFADGTNLYLAASDTGVTATILVYTVAPSGLALQLPATTLLVSSSEPGDFTVPHGIGAVPSIIEILPTSSGQISLQSPAFDATNVYLRASDAGVTATITVFGPVVSALNIGGPAANLNAVSTEPGDFAIPHGLPAAPSRIEILMLSSGEIWAQTPAFDGAYVYLTASDIGIVALISVYP